MTAPTTPTFPSVQNARDDLTRTEEARLRVDVKIWRPRPTARILQSQIEANTATDFDAVVDVSSYEHRRLIPERSYEGEVTLCKGGRGWRPCRSVQWGSDLARSLTQWGSDLSWMHGRLPRAVDDIRRDARPVGVDVSRRLIDALSGAGWPAFAAPECSEGMLELARDVVIPGDVVEHGGSRRRGYVLAIGRIHPDRTVEYLVRPAVRWHEGEGGDEADGEEAWWNSAHARRVTRRKDPYRRFLDMVFVEDDLERRSRRRIHPRTKRYGGSLAPPLWDRMFWQLSNRRRIGIDGRLTHVDLGREHWTEAANDCLARRERAANWEIGST